MKYLPTPAEYHKYWYIDIESELIPSSGIADIHKVWMMCASNLANDEVISFIGPEAIRGFFEGLQGTEAYFVGHNAISFDAPVTQRLCGGTARCGNTVDTLILSYLYNPAMPDGHSLQAWGIRMRDPKGDFNDFSGYSPEMDKYCQQDVRLGKKVFKALVQRMLKMGFSEMSCEIEHEVRVVVDEQQANGWYFDIPGAQSLVSHLRSEQLGLEGPIRDLFPPRLVVQGTYNRRTKQDGTEFASYLRHLATFPEVKDNGDGTYSTFDWQEFNIGSPIQRVNNLLSLGWVPVDFTEKGFPKVDEESLLAFAELSGKPEAKAIAEWLVLQGRASMVEGWLNNVNYDDHCMHGRVMTCAATTRRMIHSGPNTANIPKAKAKIKYGIECRRLWMARPGRLEVGGDASGLEMRMFAEYLGTDEAVKLFTEGDPHLLNTRNLELPDHMRDLTVKNGFYAYLYGAGDPKLGRTLKPELQGSDAGVYGKWARGVLERGTPGLARLVADIGDEFKHTGGVLRTIDGGFVRCQSRSAALNYKLQSAGAIVMKVAAILARREMMRLGLDAMLVGTIHDESQYDCSVRDATRVGEVFTQAIRDAGEYLAFTCPLDGAFKVGANWAECH